MPVEIALNTPLAEALNNEIQPKLVEVGWGSGDSNDTALSEYIILMLVNGKTQEEIAAELSGDLLNLGPDDPGAREFASWLFQQIDVQNARLNGGQPEATAVSQPDAANNAGAGDDEDMDMNAEPAGSGDLNAPTGPKAMRNNSNPRGNRGRMMGQINRALDRNNDSVLHRVRGQNGNERINSHRTPPSGPRMGVGRQPRNANVRSANIVHGMATGMGGFAGGPAGPGGMNGMPANFNMMGGPQSQQAVDMYAMLEQQSRMMQQMQQQMQQQMMQQGGGFRQNGRPLNERIRNPNRGNFRGGHQQNGHHHQNKPAAAEGEDVDMGGEKREPPNADETICKYNLRCTNKECKFAHQSPAAPPGITIDAKDVCTFGVACKNHKCVGRHPSPATKMAHQSEQDCKFFPNCTNPRCPFRHPSMPLCRNGADCSVEGCKFTHVQTMCKFTPCTNRFCTFKHAEGQRGAFQDKVWTADGGGGGGKQHVSERKFVDENAPEESIIPEQDKDMGEGEGVTV